MGRIEDYVEAVTERLRPDAELHMDVAHEVRTHLEEAAAEARSRGLSEEESVEAALKAFGDASVIAEQMWQANRGRMRMRALIKWAARVTLVPAALLVTLLLATADAELVVQQVRDALRVTEPVSWPKLRPPGPKPGLTDEQRLAFDRLTGRAEDAKALVERYPHDRAYYAYYVEVRLEDLRSPRLMDAQEFREALAVADRGQEIEPDNALYDYVNADLLMRRSSEYVLLDEDDVDRTLVVRDPVLFGQGIREFLKGTRKPYLNSHTRAILERKVAWTRPPASVLEEVAFLSELNNSEPPSWRRRAIEGLAQRVRDHVLSLVAQGDREAALELLSAMGRPAMQLSESAQLPQDFGVAEQELSWRSGVAAGVYERLAMPAEAAAAQKRYEAENAFLDWGWEGSEAGKAERQRAVTHPVLSSGHRALPPGPWTPALRIAEHIVLQRAALAALAATALLLVVFFAALSCWGAVRLRARPERPKMLFVGWRRLAWMCLICLVLPGAAYWAYTRAAPWSSMGQGLKYGSGRAIAELTVLYAWVLVSLMAMSYSAIRARCAEAGMDVPPRSFFRPLRRPVPTAAALLVGLGVAATGGLALWYVYGAHAMTYHRFSPTLVAACGIVAFVLCFARFHYEALRRADPQNVQFRTTFARSVIPILAASVILLGGASWGLLGAAEKAQIRLANAPGQSILLDEPAMAWLRERWQRFLELDQPEQGVPQPVAGGPKAP